MYDALAENFHLIFQDWSAAVEWEGEFLHTFLTERAGIAGPLRILDCACGIGTQTLGLAARGHFVVGTDLSVGAAARARREAEQRGLSANYAAADMTDLRCFPDALFDVVISFDNSLPHLSDPAPALRQIAAKLKPGGLFCASVRDYRDRPAIHPPRFHTDSDGRRRIVHQVWDWVDDRSYILHLYITVETATGWRCLHYVSRYYALTWVELSAAVLQAGLRDAQWLPPSESGFYQPIVTARRA